MRFDQEQAAKKRILMIAGKESVLRNRTLAHVVEALGTGKDDFDFESIAGDMRPPLAWVASVSTVPFLSPYRTLVVRHVLRAEVPDDGAALLKSVPESGRLVLVADDEATPDDDPSRRQAPRSMAWEKVVGAAGGLVIKCDADSKTVSAMLVEEAKLLDKKLSTVAANVLNEMSGGSFSRALDELQKLAIFTGDEPEIREADVLAVATPSREWNVFKLLDSVVARQAAGALKQLQILVGGSSKADDAGNRNIIPQMSRQFRLLWQARACIDAKVHPASAPAEFSKVFLDKYNLARENDWVRSRAMDAARKLTSSQIERCLSEVADADARLKGQLPGASPMETLEMLVLRCVAIIQARA